MKPTAEQEAILSADGRIIRINARAGTGKTTTLVMLSEQHPNKRILYLVFNRKAREAAQQRFPANVQVHTVHSLAYSREGFRWKDNLGSFTPVDMLQAFGKGKVAHQLSGMSHQFLTFFLNSPHTRLEDAVDFFAQDLNPELTGLFEKHKGKIIQACRDIATAWNQREKTCPHDFYLKLFHKSGQFHNELDRYDMILVDEAQDLSPVMLDALEKCGRRIVLVGDSHQQIYSFRYAIDAMRRLTCDDELQLSLSFRFGSSIADLASLLIQEAKKDKGFRIRGNPEKSSIISFSSSPGSGKGNFTRAILSRTNLALFSNAMRLRSEGKTFHFERDLQPVLFRTLDLYWLSLAQNARIRDPFIGSFPSLEQLGEYAESMGDFPLMGMAQIVKKYGNDSFPSVVFEMSDHARNRNAIDRQDGVILSTIHSAKGQEYEEVTIDSDIADNLAAASQNGSRQYEEEVNVAYVGFTRAAKRLYLPSVLQTLLTDKWKNRLGAYLGRSSSRTTKSTRIEEQGFQGSPRKSRKFSDLPQTPPKRRIVVPSFSLGDRVQTPHGPGTIVEISGDQCLVDLETQPAKLWERLLRLRAVQ